MQRVVWLAAGLVGFALLQAVLYRYLQRGNSSSEQPTVRAGAQTDTPRDGGTRSAENGVDAGPGPRPEDHTADGIRCRHCGAHNERDAVYTYCRRCGQRLE